MLGFLLGAIAFAVGSFLISNLSSVSTTSQPHKQLPENNDVIDITPIKPEKTFADIKETNREIEELRKKAQQDKILREQDQERMAQLERRVDELYHNYEQYKHNQVLQLAQNNPQNYEDFTITPDKLHLIQYHVGETVVGKKCFICQRPMVLQFKRDKVIITMDDLFWACTGWYYDECQTTQNFSVMDMTLFSQNDKEEFYITNQELVTIFGNKSIQEHTTARMKRHRGERVDDYVCPIHKEPLVLRQKKVSGGALDDFFLGCSRWKPQDGCTYVLKLKSPAQLASFLYKTEQKGIL